MKLGFLKLKKEDKKNIKIGFFGFGKTGKEAILPFLEEESMDVEWVIKKTKSKVGDYASNLYFHKKKQGRIYPSEELDAKFLAKHPVDVVVDFSNSENVDNYELLASKGIKIVSAVSNYTPLQTRVLKNASKSTAVLWSPNITIGVNLLIIVSKLIKHITPEADVQIIESHFSTKKGRSGTSLRMASEMDVPEENIHSIRAGGILGNHKVIFGYPYQTIRLEHDAISRQSFGRGALACAEWLMDKKPGLYSMENIFEEKIKQAL